MTDDQTPARGGARERDSRERRERAVRDTLASSKLEGVTHSDAFTRNLDRYVSGDISAKQLGESARG